MCTVNIEISDSINSAVELFAKKNNISVQQFIINAINEKMSALEQNGYLEERANKGRNFDIKAFFNKIPDSEPQEWDRKPVN